MTVLETHHRIGVLDFRRRGEMRADQRAPFGKILRTAKIHRVVFQRLPCDVQPVARRLFDGAVQLETFPALAAPEDGFRLGDRGLKILFAAWLDVDLCAFGDPGVRSLLTGRRLYRKTPAV